MKKQRIVLNLIVTAMTASPVWSEDLVFRTVAPCVAFDTRPAFGGTGPLAAEEVRSFHIVGSSSNFAAQGGAAGGCGVPGFSGGQPIVQAVFVNYVAIAAQGPGQLKVWAADQTEPDQGGIVNYQLLSPAMNNSNGVITAVRQDVEGADIKVRARNSSVPFDCP